jgi:hypothetical protein
VYKAVQCVVFVGIINTACTLLSAIVLRLGGKMAVKLWDAHVDQRELHSASGQPRSPRSGQANMYLPFQSGVGQGRGNGRTQSDICLSRISSRKLNSRAPCGALSTSISTHQPLSMVGFRGASDATHGRHIQPSITKRNCSFVPLLMGFFGHSFGSSNGMCRL